MGRLDGKVAVITGGARGMGKAHVRRFVAEGAKVVFGDLLEEAGGKLATDLGDAVRFVAMDVTEAADWQSAVGTAVSEFGRLDVLVNNAGVIRHRPIEQLSVEEFKKVVDINLVGQFLGIKSVVEPMKAAGGGSIINVSSTDGYVGAAGLSAYSASKFAVRGLTKSAARELGEYGIRVNSLHPGGILTSMTLDEELVAATADSAEHFLANLPLRRMGNTAEVTGAVVFLASDDAGYCTGTEILVDGGMLTGGGH